ncbi:MAG TPA: type II toxin-antitoxin system death-on-curing family toxin [Chloroflexota bacterium]
MSSHQAPEYLTFDEVIRLHTLAMAAEGLPPFPLRDLGLLESALQRPQNAASYGDADLVAQAVLLTQAIAQAQAFIDGNKRTALAAFDVFLQVNGLDCDGDANELAVRIEAVAAPGHDERAAAVAELERWVRDHTR